MPARLELEFFVEDVNLYRDLARAETPAGGLRMATRDRPSRSTRYRDYLQSGGFGDELRAVMRVDGHPWAMLCLFREQGRPPFDAEDARFVGRTATALAALVREHARPAPWTREGGADRGPGLPLFAPSGELISINDNALAWLDELPPEHDDVGAFGVRLPTVVAGTQMRARAIAAQRDDGTTRARLRSRTTGRWLVCHASCMRATDAELVLSPHTVRDYVKAIFDKVQVRSRGELVAKLFAEHYLPQRDPADRDRVDDF